MVEALDEGGEVAAHWSLSFEDLALLTAKPVTTRLGFAAQLMMYRATGRFGRAESDFSSAALAYLSEQIKAAPTDLVGYDWAGRSGRRHRSEILDYLGLRRARPQDVRDAAAWMGAELCPLGLSVTEMMERLLGWFVARRIASPEAEVLTPLIVTARRTFEDNVLQRIGSVLSSEHRRRLDASLADEDSATGFSGLKADPGEPNLDNVLIAARRLAFVKSLALPSAALPDLGDPVARTFRRRVVNETGKFRLVVAPVDVSTLVNDIVDDFSVFANASDVVLSAAIEPLAIAVRPHFRIQSRARGLQHERVTDICA